MREKNSWYNQVHTQNWPEGHFCAMSTDNGSSNGIKEYKWYNSCSLPVDLQCVIVRAEFSEDLYLNHDIPETLSVDASLVCNQINMHVPCTSTLFSQIDHSRNAHVWRNMISFPIKVRDLSLDTIITFTVKSADGDTLCGTTMRIFDENGAIKQGKQKLMVFFGREGDPNVVIAQNKTPGEYFDHFQSYDHHFAVEKRLESFRSSTYQGTAMPWLDKLLLKRIQEGLNLPYRSNDYNDASSQGGFESKYMSEQWGKPLQEFDLKRFSFLIIELPQWPHLV